MLLATWIKDVCICTGDPERVVVNGLSLVRCSGCKKPSRIKAPGAYSATEPTERRA